MTTKTTLTTATFLRPFTMPGIEGVLPAGSYAVETDQEQVLGVSHVVYRRIRTTITIPGRSAGVRQVVEIEPDDLAAALERDAVLAAKTEK